MLCGATVHDVIKVTSQKQPWSSSVLGAYSSTKILVATTDGSVFEFVIYGGPDLEVELLPDEEILVVD